MAAGRHCCVELNQDVLLLGSIFLIIVIFGDAGLLCVQKQSLLYL